MDDIGDLYVICDKSGHHTRVQFPLLEVWKGKMAIQTNRDPLSFSSSCPFLRLYFHVENYAEVRREQFLYLETPEVWSDDALINDEDDLRAYWIAATLPAEVSRQKENYDHRDQHFWLKHFGTRKNNAIFHMNGRKYFKEVKKINEFLHVSLDAREMRANTGHEVLISTSKPPKIKRRTYKGAY